MIIGVSIEVAGLQLPKGAAGQALSKERADDRVLIIILVIEIVIQIVVVGIVVVGIVVVACIVVGDACAGSVA